MRGKYKSEQRRVLSGFGYKIAIGVIVAIAVALVMVLLAVLPIKEDTIKAEKRIVSIEDSTGGIGVGSDPSLIFVTVTYSDGTTESVPLSGTVYEGLDLNSAGKNNVVISYGGFEQSITFDVKDVNCVINYESSVGGTILGETSQSVVNGGSTTTVVAVPETGYIFSGWKDGYPYPSRKDVNVVENKTLIASFEKAKYTVRFYYNDGTVGAEEKVSFGEAATKAPVYGADPRMTVYGHRFQGWVPNDFTSVDRDMNIYPEYVKTATDVIMTVPADVYGNDMGKVTMNEQGYYAHDEAASILATPFNSRTFSHWLITDVNGIEQRLDKDGTVSVAVGVGGQELTFTSVKSGNTAEDYNLTFTPNADVTQISVKAIFAYSATDITFVNYQKTDNNGVEYVASGLPFGKPISYITGDSLPVPKDVNGLEFLGWYLSGDSAQKLITKDETFTQPTTLIAKWKRKQYVLKFVAVNEATGKEEVRETTVTYQDVLASGANGGIPADFLPERKDYNFVGWMDALTGRTVDDKTQIYYDSRYEDTTDFKDGIIRIIPIWSPKAHRLSVNLNGSGIAVLIIDEGKFDSDGNSLEERVSVNGEITVYQNRNYKLSVEALEGNVIVSANVNSSYYDYEPNTVRAEFTELSKADNVITANFSVKKLLLTVTNGDGTYAGTIGYENNVYGDGHIEFSVDYGTSAVLKIESPNKVYSIKDIKINGVSLGINFKDVSEYTLVLPTLKNDAAVNVEYYTRKYTVSVSMPEGGTVVETDIYDLTRENEFDSNVSYSYGDKLYLRIKADGNDAFRNVISQVRVNGVVCDLYANAIKDINLHNRYVNGVSLEVVVTEINGGYYYVYGEGSYEVGGRRVLCVYGEDFEGNSKVFTVTVSGEDKVYTLLPAEENKALYDAIKSDLDIANRSIFNTVANRDMRITSLDIIIDVSRDYDISVGFKPVKYSVTATAAGEGVVTVSESSPFFGGRSVITASPSSGFYVSGYTVNGEVFTAENSKKGEDYSLNLEGITEDKDVEFTFEAITFNVTFLHASGSGSVYADGKLLNNSFTKLSVYRSSVSADITIDENHVITSVKTVVNGIEENLTVHYNMQSYVFTYPEVVSSVTVIIETAEKNVSLPVNGYAIDFNADAIGGEATVSAEYPVADPTLNNRIRVMADYGYTINSITVRNKNSSVVLDSSVTAGARGTVEFDFSIPANTFKANENVVIKVETAPVSFALTTSKTGEGSISIGTTMLFNEEKTVDITADGNCYIAAVFINGEEISFGSRYWSSLNKNTVTGKYTSGVIKFFPEKDMDIRAVFSRNVYKLTVFDQGVNGETTLSVSKNDEWEEGAKDVDGIADGSNSDYVPHGWFVNVNMSADAGYHISALYINDVKIELQFLGDDINEFRSATYRYKGEVVENKSRGASGRINIKVVYEINKYGFVYSIVNASQNFANDTYCGTLTSAYAADGNRYYGIEHGSNFSFNVNPSTTNGYYLKSVRVLYKSVYDSAVSEIIHTPGDSALADVTEKGGTVWFNRFLETAEGLTADVELIEVTFDRNLYTVEAEQTSAIGTGTVNLTFSHSNADVKYAVIYDTEGGKYGYSDGKFYNYADGEYTETSIKLVNKNGKYVFTDGVKEYKMLVEHGLRYTVFVTPTEGYERIKFTVNGENSLSAVNDNRFGRNVERSIKISVEYRIITFDVKFSLAVNNENRTGTVAPSAIKNYADIYVQVLNNGHIYTLDYRPIDADGLFSLGYGEEEIRLSSLGYKLGYGAKIQFIMYPKFAQSGYYLTSFVFGTDITDRVKTEVITLPETGETEVYVYGGQTGDGYEVRADIEARCVFDVTRYRVHTEVLYTDGVTGETVNFLKEESGMSTAWGSAADIQVFIGKGFILESIYVKRGEEGTYRPVNLNYVGPNELDEQMYYDRLNTSTREERDFLKVRRVVTDIYVRANISRQHYQARYVVNGAEHLNDITTVYNENHAGYPVTTVSSLAEGGRWEGNVYVLDVYHYDELSAVITPKNGYEIKPVTDGGKVEYKVIVRAVKQNENGDWEYVTDNAGNLVFTELYLSTVTGDVKSFTFHSASSPIAATNVSSDLEIEITVGVKTYRTTTSAVFTDAVSANETERNETTVTWEVKDGGELTSGNFTLNRNGKSAVAVAEHHGYLNYRFVTSVGYRLSQIAVNGAIWRNIEYEWTDPITGEIKRPTYDGSANTTGYVSEGLRYTVTYDPLTYTYTYDITFVVNDALVKGLYGTAQKALQVNMEISPIAYEIKGYINGVNYENAYYDGVSGISDGKTAKVFMPSQGVNYGTFRVNPSPVEGYEIRNLSVRTGKTDALESETEATSYNITNVSSAQNFRLNATFLPNADLLQGETTVHVYYVTGIKSYGLSVEAYGYSYGDGVVKYPDATGANGSADLSEGYIDYESSFGQVAVTVTTEGANADFPNGTFPHSGRYEYYSEVKIEAYANEIDVDGGIKKYVVYDIVEIVSGKETSVADGVRGISYYTEREGENTKYIVRFTVDKSGDRQFKIIFKQKIEVSVRVPNPYKYVDGTESYRAYVDLTAQENGVDIDNKNYIAGEVCDYYVYDVLAGNYFSLIYKDMYPKSGQTSYGFYTDPEGLHSAGLGKNSTDYTDGLGKKITGNTELYLLTDVYSRVSFTKDTVGAVENAEGGIVYFNDSGVDQTSGYLYTSATVTNKVLRITAEANNSYAFSNLYVRQRDEVRSRRAGEIIYKQGSEEWLAFNPDTFASLDSNGFSITEEKDSDGTVTFVVTMRGDMELKVEFYRVYKLSYGIHFSDREAEYFDYGDAASAVKAEVDERYNVYGASYAETYGKDGYYLQYGSSITLEAPATPSDYVFVGWYLNGLNTYVYLDSILPGNGYLKRQFIMDSSLSGLVTDGNETDSVVFVAIYQYIIDVAVINETYYVDSSDAHWNSWASGYLRTQYYDFDGVRIASSTTEKYINNRTANAINSLSYASAYGADDWYTLYGTANISNRIYSAMHTFRTLYQSIENYDLVGDNWQDGSILLRIDSLPSDIKHISWQYYNWAERDYRDITYSYSDPNYGIDPTTGAYTVVDSTFEEYRFALNYLFAESGTERLMPYAITDLSGATRPLIIRPKLHKVVSVELTQIAYTDSIDGDYVTDADPEFYNIIHPVINSVPSTDIYQNTISDNRMSATFDYGDTVNLLYYNARENGEIRNHPKVEDGQDYEYCYRFIGWRLYWAAGTPTVADYRFISVTTAETGYDFALKYGFNSAPPSATIQLQAVYVVQYRQDFYSYNVANSDASYSEAEGYSREDAPSLYLNYNVDAAYASVKFDSYDILTGTVGDIEIPYRVTALTSSSHVLQYLMDVGTRYEVISDINRERTPEAEKADASSVYLDKMHGYDPEYDLFHKLYYNSVEQADTLYYTGGKYTVSGVLSTDIQYISKVAIVFENMMYGSGVTVPETLSRYLKGSVTKMTVWDNDAEYGDENLDKEIGKSLGLDENLTDNGIVVFRFKLLNAYNLNGFFNYSLKGFNAGNGLTCNKLLSYTYRVSDTDLRTEGAKLFDPTAQSYRRYVVVDYNNGYIDGGSLIFGNPSVTGTARYAASNTGDGTKDNPYRIYNRTQFRNVGKFFYANENTCRMINASGVSTPNYFRLYGDISLQDGVSHSMTANPAGDSIAWTPLTYFYEGSESELGFDGVFDGNNHALYDLAVFDGYNPDSTSSVVSNVNREDGFDYDNLQGYGIFGCINGGVVKNLKIGDSFVALHNPSYASVGLLASKIYDSTISSVEFIQVSEAKVKTGVVKTSEGGARIFIDTYASKIGMIAGYVSGGTIKDVTVNGKDGWTNGGTVSNGSEGQIYIMTINGGEKSGVGMLVGYMEGRGNGAAAPAATADGLHYVGKTGVTAYVNESSATASTGGLIGTIDNGVTLRSSDLTGANIVLGANDTMATIEIGGGIVGTAINSNITGCSISSLNVYERNKVNTGIRIYAENTSGGIVGKVKLNANYAGNTEMKVSACEISGVVRMRGKNSGGVAGENDGGRIYDCGISAPTSQTGAGARLVFDIAGSRGTGSNFGGIVGLNDGTVDNCRLIGSSGAALYNAGYTKIDGAVIYVSDSGMGSPYTVPNITTDSISAGSVNSLARGAKNISGYVYVGGIAGLSSGRIYNSYLIYTRITVNLDVNAVKGSNENNGDAYNKHSLVVSAGGISGGVQGASSVNAMTGDDGYYKDGSDRSFADELTNQSEYIPSLDEDGKEIPYKMPYKYKTRVQSCYTNSASIVVANRYWVDAFDMDADSVAGLAASNAITIGGVVGSISGYVGNYAVNTCYSYKNNFSVQTGAYGLINAGSKDNTEVSSAFGWNYKEDGITVGRKKYYNAIRRGLRVDGGIFGVVGAEFASIENDASRFNGKRYGCDYCWCAGNTVESNGFDKSTSAMSTEFESPVYYRGVDREDMPKSASFAAENIACRTSGYPENTMGLRVSGMEYFMADITSDPIEINGNFVSFDTFKKIKVLFGGGFYGDYDSAKGGGSDGRVFKTDPETGMLIVARQFADNSYYRLNGQIINATYSTNGLSKYLVGNQTAVLSN